jgi:hypothetical protein
VATLIADALEPCADSVFPPPSATSMCSPMLHAGARRPIQVPTERRDQLLQLRGALEESVGRHLDEIGFPSVTDEHQLQVDVHVERRRCVEHCRAPAVRCDFVKARDRPRQNGTSDYFQRVPELEAPVPIKGAEPDGQYLCHTGMAGQRKTVIAAQRPIRARHSLWHRLH